MKIWKTTFEHSVIREEVIIGHLLEEIRHNQSVMMGKDATVVYDLDLKRVIIYPSKRNEINEQS